MSAENKKITQILNDYKNKFSEEKQRLGMEDEKTEEKIDNIENFLEIGDESNSNRIKLSNERKQDYLDYLSKQNYDFTKPNEYFEDVSTDNFLGFGKQTTQDKHGYHKDVILAEKRQLSHDQLDNERKEEYQTYLSKKDNHFSTPKEYFETVNTDSFLGFGEDAKQPKSGYRKHGYLDESRQTTIEKLQNSLQQTSISNYSSSMLSLGHNNDDNKDRLLKERRQDYQDYLQDKNDKPNKNVQEIQKDTVSFTSPEKNVHAQNAKERHLAALAHSPLHNQREDNSQISNEHHFQSLQDEKRRQHEQYFEELNQQIADKKQYNIEKANREQLRDENEQDDTQNDMQNIQDEKRRQREEYHEQLNQQIAAKKILNIEKANRERLEDEAIIRYENNHAMF